MGTDHRGAHAEPTPTGRAGPRGRRPPRATEGPASRGTIAQHGAVVAFGLYLLWSGTHGSPVPGSIGGEDRSAWTQAGPDAWSAQSVVGLAAGLLAVLVGSVGVLLAVRNGGARAAALRARVRARFHLILFALTGTLFTVAGVVLVGLWSTGVAFRSYEVDGSTPDGAMYGILVGVCTVVAGVGWTMVVSLVSGPAHVLRPGERLPTWRLVLRPFGYLAIGTVWAALWLAILAVGAALPVALSDRRPIGLADTPLSSAAGIVDLQGNPLALIAVAVLLGPLLAAVFGWVVGMLPLTAWPLAALSFVYVARPLRPSYAGEALSGTVSCDSAIGPPTATATALSLLPMRSSRLTDALMKAYLAGWTPSFAMVRSCFWLGLGYVFATVWTAWPVRSPALVGLCSVVSVSLAAYSVRRLVVLARATPGRPVP